MNFIGSLSQARTGSVCLIDERIILKRFCELDHLSDSFRRISQKLYPCRQKTRHVVFGLLL